MGRNMIENVIREDRREGRRAPEEEVPNGDIADWFGALFTFPVSVRIALDALAKFKLRWGLYLSLIHI